MRASIFGKSGNGRDFISSAALFVAVGISLSGCGGGGGTETDVAAVSTERTMQATAATRAAATTGAVTGPWLQIAPEGQYFQVAESVPVRYGYGNNWVKIKTLKGNYRCEVATFGVDPAPGVQKVCQARSIDGSAGQGNVSWTPSGDSAVVGYRVYYGTASKVYAQAPGSGLFANDQNQFSLAGLPVGKTYYFAVTSIDAAGKESAFSNEAAKLVQ